MRFLGAGQIRKGLAQIRLTRDIASVGEFRDVPRLGLVGLSPRVQTGDPAPAQGVRGRVAVQKMAEKEIGPDAPWQAQGEDPDRGEPHPRVIVQVAGLDQFRRPGVETGQAGLARLGRGDSPAQPAILLERDEVPVETVAIAVPNARAAFQPALEIAPPDHLLDEFFGRFRAMRIDGGRDRLALGHQAAAQIRREHRHVPVRARAAVEIAPPRIARAHPRREGRKPRQAGGPAGLGKSCHESVSACRMQGELDRGAGKSTPVQGRDAITMTAGIGTRRPAPSAKLSRAPAAIAARRALKASGGC